MALEDTHHRRTISHFDLDAFYVACERELNPSLLHQPVAVSQYNPYGNLHETHSSEIEKRLIVRPNGARKDTGTDGTGTSGTNTNAAANVMESLRAYTGLKKGGDENGSMIAVSYEARSKGIKRGDRGLEAVKKCPDLHIVQVPVKRGKADLTMYRDASHRIMETLISSLLNELPDTDGNESDNVNGYGSSNGETGPDWIGKHVLTNIKRANLKVEKASIDEIYIDLSVPVDKMTELLVSLQNDEQNAACTRSNQYQQKMNIWRAILHQGQVLGCTTIGGIETMSRAARAACGLSKNEVRKGSKFQVQEQCLDSGSQIWWQRPLVEWSPVDLRLACGSALASRARSAAEKKFAIYRKENDGTPTRIPIFTLSGGISSNKTLAKLASGLKKPNRQTMINPSDYRALSTLFHPLKINRLRGLGGKFGESVMETLNVSTVGDLSKVPLTVLKQKYPPAIDDERPIADFLYTISKGICLEEVSERTVEKSISSGKTFRGPLAISVSDEAKLDKWISELIYGLLDRLNTDHDENVRLPTLVSLSMKIKEKCHAISKSAKAPQNLSHEAYVATVKKLSCHFPREKDGKIYGLTVTASNFMTVASGESSIMRAFQRNTQTGSECESKMIPADVNEPTATISTCGNRIDKSIMSQLPPSIQSELRVATMSGIGNRNTTKTNVKQSSAANMKSWLTNSSPSESKKKCVEKKEDCTRKIQKKQETRTSTDCFFIKQDDIDLAVLAELPWHIQASIRKEMRTTKKRRILPDK